MARGRDGWTASGLRELLTGVLPPVGPELFMHAGAIVAGRLAVAGAAGAEIEAALRRAADQALVAV